MLRVAIYQDNAPWSWEEGGQIKGIDADLGRALAAALGVKADLAIFPAGESVEDDLRNAVWRGGLLGFQAADVMLHVPFDPALLRSRTRSRSLHPMRASASGWPAPRAGASNAKVCRWRSRGTSWPWKWPRSPITT
ncbi:hypothetical protein ACFS32_19705 [Novosphingobium pokkalii]|uniref:hypothetical protein n=1 Tax=Novosphingobium pokkalii TaxID=1770194 RepID=UPI003626CCFE